MSQHAYLIMAHQHPEQLRMLMRCLDYKNNDIFLHIDAKYKDFDGIKHQLSTQVRNAKLVVLRNRVDVRWGDFSQIECELRLLEAATSESTYSYYHLLSGADLPLASQQAIHNYFDEHQGTEFIHFDKHILDRSTYERVSKYAFFSGRHKNIIEKTLYRLILTLQIGVDRGRRYGIKYQKGANWFSITDELARYVVSQRKEVEHIFKRTRCGDEFMLQTIVANSYFKNRIYTPNYCDSYDSIRYCIDWQRGNPYTFRQKDYGSLISSGMLFARKFDSDIDQKIIDMIVQFVTKQQEV